MAEIEFWSWSVWGKACVFPTRPHHLISLKHGILIWSWLPSLTSFPTVALYPLVTLIVSSLLRHSSSFFNLYFLLIQILLLWMLKCFLHLVTSLYSLKINWSPLWWNHPRFPQAEFIAWMSTGSRTYLYYSPCYSSHGLFMRQFFMNKNIPALSLY